MSDRELLERAARAAGLQVKSDRNSTWIVEDDGSPVRRWLPLTDDGDALRLAVKLRLGLEWWKTGVSAESPQHGPSGIQHFEGDPQAATRRAIVRAAAAMADGAK
jgi:hypothetical protein